LSLSRLILWLFLFVLSLSTLAKNNNKLTLSLVRREHYVCVCVCVFFLSTVYRLISLISDVLSLFSQKKWRFLCISFFIDLLFVFKFIQVFFIQEYLVGNLSNLELDNSYCKKLYLSKNIEVYIDIFQKKGYNNQYFRKDIHMI